MKKCTKCGILKKLSEFHKDRTHTKDGLASQCKNCKNKRDRERYHRNKRNQQFFRIVKMFSSWEFLIVFLSFLFSKIIKFLNKIKGKVK